MSHSSIVIEFPSSAFVGRFLGFISRGDDIASRTQGILRENAKAATGNCYGMAPTRNYWMGISLRSAHRFECFVPPMQDCHAAYL
jgi:hypothetical protein